MVTAQDRPASKEKSRQGKLGRKDRARLEKRQDKRARAPKTGSPWQERQDSQNKIAKAVQLEQDNQDRTSVAGEL